MKNLIINETESTPYIKIDVENGIFEFTGKSYPENSFTFYEPILNLIEEYFNTSPLKRTVINFKIIYINSSTSKIFFTLFDLIEESQNKGHIIKINWIFERENDSALEIGKYYKEDFDTLTFNFVEKKS